MSGNIYHLSSHVRKSAKPLSDLEERELKEFIFVTKESHLKIVCTCPECGISFFHWLQDGHDFDIETIKMEMATTLCSFHRDEEIEEELS